MTKTLVAVFGLATVAAVGACASCSDSSAPAAASADSGADAAVDAATDRKAEDAATDYGMDGWFHLDFDPEVDCGFFTAPTPEKMPPPIEWEACPDFVGAVGVSCRKIKVTWPAATSPYAQTPPMTGGYGWTDEGGRALLVVNRFTGPRVLRLVAEADGPVRHAIAETSRDCTLGSGASLNKHVVYTAIRGTSKAVRRGAIGGALDQPARVLESWGDGTSHDYVAGPNAYFDYGRNALQSWTGDAGSTQLSIKDPGEVAKAQFQGDTLFFTVEDLAYARIKVFSAASGLKDFVSFGNDVSKNAADFGSDAADMAWIEASGRSNPNEKFATVDLMTAKFTSDPAMLSKRRVRSALGSSVGVSPFVVGCGYAAREYTIAGGGAGVQLTRLSDGHSWRIEQIKSTSYWSWSNAIAISCEEVFLNVAFEGRFFVARVRIDSLGPGELAD